MEWDLNDWKWDGDLFVAAPLSCVPSDCGRRQLIPVGSDIPSNNGASNAFLSGSDEAVVGHERERRDMDKRKRDVEANAQVNEEAGSLNLKLGGQVFPLNESEVDKCEHKSGKKTKILGAPSSRAVCQVEDCQADLRNAKDYHRRHKVCEVHSKATSALVGNSMQRFCQQCSRFHVIQEFDEGKRSCRRRLAGHNKRRRKTHLDNAITTPTLNDEQGSNYLLISLLRILSNIQSTSSNQTKDQDLISHLLRNLASHASSINETSHAGLLSVSQDVQNVGTSLGTADSTRPAGPDVTVPSSNLTQKGTLTDNAEGGGTQNASAAQQSVLVSLTKASSSIREKDSDSIIERAKLNNIDLNNAYDTSQDHMEDLQDNLAPKNVADVSTVVPLRLGRDSQQSSPPHNSVKSGSTPSQSLSTSNGEAQSRTDRIVFKLFGKDPSDFPLVLRKQILDWLSSSPKDIESYIRPGCVVLTIYACMDKYTWEELYCNLNSSLRRLLNSSSDSFWRTGWMYTRVRHRATFVYNGQVVVDTPLPLEVHQSCRISSVTPIAVPITEAVHFVVKGFKLSHPSSRLLCALEGKYLVQKNCADMAEETDSFIENEEIQCLRFSCVTPSSVGRGFIEVEDHGLNSSFFPFIVAEKDVCSEICNLESIIGVTEAADGDTDKVKARNRALDFIHEMGWLLHKSCLRFRLKASIGDVDLYPFKRFRWLVEFAIDRDWRAVLKKLLSILFDGTVDAGENSSILVALLDICVLHEAVRKKSRSVVEFLLEYHPRGAKSKEKQLDDGHYLFRPDTAGPGGLTPLHIAASLDSCENVLDALTEDPGSVGIEAWKNARDSTGLTPYDYACLRGHYSYINLVQRKLNKRKSGKEQVAVDIPGALLDSKTKQKMVSSSKCAKWGALETAKAVGRPCEIHCRECEWKLGCGSSSRASLAIYRPAMISMVAIAAVCVCAALLFKSSPEVVYSFQPFSWELLKYGAQ